MFEFLVDIACEILECKTVDQLSDPNEQHSTDQDGSAPEMPFDFDARKRDP